MHRKQVLCLYKSQNLRILQVSPVQSPVDGQCYREHSFYFPLEDLSDVYTFKREYFFSGPETVVLGPQVPPVSCQKLNPGSDSWLCLFPIMPEHWYLSTEFWEFDSELHSLGLSICVHIPNGCYVLICSGLVSLFKDSCLIFLGLGICSFGFLAEGPDLGPLLASFGL